MRINLVNLDETLKKIQDDHEFLEKSWIRGIDIIINMIKKITNEPVEMLRLLFEYFTRDDMKYVLNGVTPDGRRALPISYYKKGVEYTNAQKYPAVFNQEGICSTYSLAFENIVNRMGIPCRVVTGDTGMDHAWNIVMIDGRVYHIDIAFALLNRNAKYNYFMVDGFNRNYKCNYKRIVEEMSKQISGKSYYIESDLNALGLEYKNSQASKEEEVVYSNRIKVYK